jgi:RNA polymerase sigma factor (sigma-70 family)
LDSDLGEGYRTTLPAGDLRAEAFDAFVLHNTRLVWSIALTFQYSGMDPDDLYQSGIFGLIRAVEKYNATMGWKFSTYATWWIKQSIGRAIANESRLVRLPVHVHERINKMLRARERLEIERGRAWARDIAEATGYSVDEVTEGLRLSVGAISLHTPIGDGGATLEEVVFARPDPGSDPWTQLSGVFLRAIIDEALDQLPEREARVITLRAGLDRDESRTLDEVGKIFGVTRERVRQIESKARPIFLSALRDRGVDPATFLVMPAEPKKAKSTYRWLGKLQGT